MITVFYTPKRKLHPTNSDAFFSFETQSFDENVIVDKRETKTLDGKKQTALNYINDGGQVKTEPLRLDDYRKMEEFLYSVSGGELFVITFPDTKDPINAKLNGDFSKQRISTNTDFFEYSFSYEQA